MAPRSVLGPTVLRPLDGVPHFGDDGGLGDYEYIQFLVSGLPSPAEFPEPGGNAEIMKAAAGGLSGTGEPLQQTSASMVSSFRKNECSNVPKDTLMTHKESSFLMNERPSLHQPLLQTWPSSGGVPRALGGDDLLNRVLGRDQAYGSRGLAPLDPLVGAQYVAGTCGVEDVRDGMLP